MGCAQSRLPPRQQQRAEDSAPVALCRARSALLAGAVRRRYELADAHAAYAASLRAAGAALHDFLRAVQDAVPPPPAPELRLPAQRKGDEPAGPLPPAALASPPPLQAAKRVDDEHILFLSDEDDSSDSDDGDDGHIRFPCDEETEPPLPRPEAVQPVAPALAQPPPPQMAGPYGFGYPASYSYGPAPAYGYGYGQSFMSYARSQPPPPSVSYEHRPQVTNATLHYYQSHNAAEPPPPASYYGGYPYQYPQGGSFLPPMAASARQPAAPMPPPSPPRVSTWDFLNPFESFESHYQEQPAGLVADHMPSRSSSDPLDDDEDEDMPELEDDESEEDIQCNGVNVKLLAKDGERRSSAIEELHRKSKLSDASSGALSEELRRESKSSDASSGIRSRTDHVAVDKSAVEEQLKHSVVPGPPAVPEKMYNDDVQVVQEIKAQFDRASMSAGDVCKALEVGKVPYNQKKSGSKVSSMMICRLPSMGKEFLQFEEEKAMECGNLSSTLQKLYMWEEKLLEEVKTEEKIRVLYDQKCKELKLLYEKGAEAHKLEAVEICIRKLSTKISVAIQAVNAISKKINKLRDEELWPQTHELIQAFMQMWHTMSECHQIQCHALSQAKNIDSNIAAAKFREAHIDLVKQLELQLLDMTASYLAWLNTQKSYVSTLNEWLKKGIEYVPEVTDDGVAPFSPGRLGAPPIFTICNNWASSMGRISEMEVVDTMQAFASNVLCLWERQRSEWRQGMLGEKDMDRDLRSMERDEVSMRKALKARNKKLVLVSSQSGISLSAQMLHDGVPLAETGLQSCMSKSFEAMETFAAACTNAYKDLHLRSEEEKARLAQESGGAS